MKKKVGVLLVNLGTPDSPKVSDVRKYLFEFLNDPRVIDIPALARWLLVNLIIVPFRAPKSAAEYRKLWTPEGSPLLTHGVALQGKLQDLLNDPQIDFTVELAMRYQSPSIDEVLKRMKKVQYDQIIVLPLYPQYASSTTGSTHEKIMRIMRKWYVIPEVTFISQYYDNPEMIDTIVSLGKKHDIADYDHIIFSYHGLPTSQVDKVYEDGEPCDDHSCEKEINDANRFCYKATCFATTRLIADKLGLDESRYTVAFQSRLDKNWLEPFADKVVEERAKKGDKKLLFFSPAFTADCLETTVEIGEAYEEDFKEMGGEKLTLVESLNSHPSWVSALKNMVMSRV